MGSPIANPVVALYPYGTATVRSGPREVTSHHSPCETGSLVHATGPQCLSLFKFSLLHDRAIPHHDLVGDAGRRCGVADLRDHASTARPRAGGAGAIPAGRAPVSDRGTHSGSLPAPADSP